jgi:hypothetical protein
MFSIGCLIAMYDAKYFCKVNIPLIRKRQDLGLWLKFLKETDYAYGLNESLAQCRVRSDSISASKASASSFLWKIYRYVEKLNLFQSIYYFSHYAVRGLLKTKAPGFARFVAAGGVVHTSIKESGVYGGVPVEKLK